MAGNCFLNNLWFAKNKKIGQNTIAFENFKSYCFICPKYYYVYSYISLIKLGYGLSDIFTNKTCTTNNTTAARKKHGNTNSWQTLNVYLFVAMKMNTHAIGGWFLVPLVQDLVLKQLLGHFCTCKAIKVQDINWHHPEFLEVFTAHQLTE